MSKVCIYTTPLHRTYLNDVVIPEHIFVFVGATTFHSEAYAIDVEQYIQNPKSNKPTLPCLKKIYYFSNAFEVELVFFFTNCKSNCRVLLFAELPVGVVETLRQGVPVGQQSVVATTAVQPTATGPKAQRPGGTRAEEMSLVQAGASRTCRRPVAATAAANDQRQQQQ